MILGVFAGNTLDKVLKAKARADKAAEAFHGTLDAALADRYAALALLQEEIEDLAKVSRIVGV